MRSSSRSYGRKKANAEDLSVRAIGERLPIRDQSFHVLMSRVAIMYMNIPEFTAEAHRVLKPDGKLWLTGHKFTHVVLHLSRSIRKRNVKDVIFRSYVILNGLLFHFFGAIVRFPLNRRRIESFQTRRGLRRELARRGFTDIEFFVDRPKGRGLFPHTAPRSSPHGVGTAATEVRPVDGVAALPDRRQKATRHLGAAQPLQFLPVLTQPVEMHMEHSEHGTSGHQPSSGSEPLSAYEPVADGGTSAREKISGFKNTIADALESGAEKLRRQAAAETTTASTAEAGGSFAVAAEGRLGQTSNQLAGGMQGPRIGFATRTWMVSRRESSVR
jgi:hypothetical protein